MEPASTIIKRLGGPPVVSKVTATAYTAPYRWQSPREKGGTGGTIPQRYHRALLDYARSRRIKLRAADFLPARPRRRAHKIIRATDGAAG